MSTCHGCIRESVRSAFATFLILHVGGVRYVHGRRVDEIPERWRATADELEDAACEGERDEPCGEHATDWNHFRMITRSL